MLTLLVLTLLWSAAATAQPAPIQYGYDELGRLTVVVDRDGNAAIYNYDAVGNLLSIERINAPDISGPVAIYSFTPTQGKAGIKVSIFGKGFSATPSQNTISFNGVAAPVTGAAANRLMTVVPAGAQTGPITVTAPLGSAVSAKSFKVLGPLALSPSAVTLAAGAIQQFTATAVGGLTPSLIWKVNGVMGGSPATGTISTAGLYTAPASIPQPIAVTVGVADHDDPSSTGAAPVTVLASGAQLFAAAPSVSVTTWRLPTVFYDNIRASVSVMPALPTATVAAGSVTATFAPVITAIAPSSGARNSSVTLTLTGAGFADATGLTFLRNNVTDNAIAVTSLTVNAEGTQATATISISSSATLGTHVVRMTTPTGQSTAAGTGVNLFTVQ